MDKVKEIDTLLFDLDGTLYFKGTPIEGAIDAIDKLRNAGYKMSFVTNTDGRTVEAMHRRVVDMGFKVSYDEIFTPITAALTFLQQRPDKSCYCMLRDEVRESFKDVRLDDKAPDYVLIGDFEDKASIDEFNKVFRFIMNGSQILATTKSMFYFTQEGINLHTGAFVKMYEEACGTKAMLLGKPSGEFLRLALDRLGSEAGRALVIGDDIDVDLAGAKNLGSRSVLVRTGHFTEEALRQAVNKPDYIIDTVAGLTNILQIPCY